MADLLTLRELALWAERPLEEVEEDPFAVEVIDKVSQLVQHVGGHPEWTLEPGADQAPFDVRMVVLQVCRRTYVNPGMVVHEGSLGPIGGDRTLNEAAMASNLTESERETLEKYNADVVSGDGSLFRLRTSGDDVVEVGLTMFVSDDQQVGMTPDESAWPSWDVPMFGPDDPGGEG